MDEEYLLAAARTIIDLSRRVENLEVENNNLKNRLFNFENTLLE